MSGAPLPERADPIGAPLRVLVVDDDSVDRMAVRRALVRVEPPAQAVEVGDAGEAERALAAGGIDVVLLDYRLPGEDGLSLLARLARSPVAPPIVLLTGQGDERVAVTAMKAGAADYLAKEALTPARLALTIGNVLRARHDRDRAVRADAALRTLVEASAPALGQEVLPVLVRTLAGACHARHAFVAELVDEGRTCRIQALWSDGDWKPGREYAPVASPCRQALLADGCRYDAWTGPAALGLEARHYVGCALRDAHGRAIGVLALLDEAPLDDHPSLQALLMVTAARCASEVQRASAEQALALGYRLERGLAACARALLADHRAPRSLEAALRPLAEAADAARTVLYGHESDEIDGLRLVHLAEACRGDAAPTVHLRLPYRGALRRWQNELGSGEHVSGLARMLPGGEQAVLAADRVQSVLALPLVVRNRWAGMLRFDADTPRRWQRDEIRLLRTATGMLGAYLERARAGASAGSGF